MFSKRNIIEFLDSERPRLFQYASYRLKNIQDVEDVMQNLYVKFLSFPEKSCNVEHLRAYVYRALCNDCSSHIRNSSQSKIVYVESFSEINEEELQPENFEEEFALINKLLGLIPEEQAEVIRLRLHSGLQFKEIAEITGVSLPTAKARFRYGIMKLREGLKKEMLL